MESQLLLSVVGAADGGSGHKVTALLLGILILFTAAKFGAELFERLNQPAVIGEILAGLVIGPQVLKLTRPTEITAALSELGVVFLLFLVGLETRPSEMLRIGGDALMVAIGGVALPFVLGYGFSRVTGCPQVTALFIGAALVATSVGITARVLGRLGVLQAASSRIILAAAVIDDILGLLVLAFVGGFARDGGVDYRQMALTAVYAMAFVAVLLCCGGRVVGQAQPALERLRIGHSLYLAAIGVCLALAAVAGVLGVAAIVGAFLAGVAFSEVSEETGLRRWFEGLTEFLVPFFLAGIGMQLSIHSLARGRVLATCLGLTVLAVAGKVVGCGLPALRRGRSAAVQVGVGMVPRGEVGIIVAQLGLALGALSGEMFSVLVFVAVATTLAAPPLLSRLFPVETAEQAASGEMDAAEAGAAAA